MDDAVTIQAPTDLIDGPLLRTVRDSPTEIWNDSCAVAELEWAIARGATGATTNPTIVLDVLKAEHAAWVPRIRELAAANPTWSETELTWAVIEAMAVRGAALLEPVFTASGGRTGRLSIQTDPTLYRDTKRMLVQGLRFAGLAPNIQVKFPATAAGVAAIEAATARGVRINATVCFTVPQALAVGAAVERGLDAYAANGGDPTEMTPVCTLMLGRLDDWMRAVVDRDKLAVHPDALDWAGIAAFKRVHRIYGDRGYRTRMLGAAYRHRLHWTELVGGNVVMTIPQPWQARFEASGIQPTSRIDEPVDPAFINELLERIPDFRRAYEPDGLTTDAFDTYGATVRTLRGFISSYHDLIAAVREVMLPNPDVRPS